MTTSERRHTDAAGPTPAEVKMLNAYDVFASLLESRPTEAKKFAYEVATIVEKYTQSPRYQAQQKGQSYE